MDKEEDEEEELEEVMDRSFVTIVENQATLREIVKTRHTPLVKISDSLTMLYKIIPFSLQKCKGRRTSSLPRTSR